LNIDLNQQHKQLVWDFWKSLEMVQAGDTPDSANGVAKYPF
jgi:hypothetical protein